MVEEYVSPDLVKSAFKGAMRSVFGENGSRILELHLRRFLGKDPYEALYEDPRLFCDGLRSFFGPGAKGLLTVLAKTLIRESGVQGLTPDQVIELLENGDQELKIHFFAILCSSHRRAGGAET
ncbi:MAG: hypothetical protein QW330_04215 [Nitrososphaerota archaeon]